MSTSVFSPRRILVLSLVFVILIALMIRFRSISSFQTSSAPSSTVPLFASAAFTDGDALKALGPEWTYVRQTSLETRNASFIDGTAPVRESVVKLIQKETTLLLRESRIVDRPSLERFLKTSSVTEVTVAGRQGYVLPTVDLVGGTGFVLVGDTQVLLIQDGSSSEWPKDLEPEVQAYIASVRVP